MDRVLPPQPLRPGRLGAAGKGMTTATWTASGGRKSGLVRRQSLKRLGRAWRKRVGVQGAKPGREVPVLDRRQARVLEEEDLAPQQGRLDVGELLLIQGDRQVDVHDEGADGRRERAGADTGHVARSQAHPGLRRPNGLLLPVKRGAIYEGRGPQRSQIFCCHCKHGPAGCADVAPC